ncbi:GreA/GreB family elongation factor [Algivirga pacifica]|uniref:Transcription elongation factor GreA n=1 Tax=Algivirga pacifica TaxID=1162670 RepID=A0ABP9D4Q5_9BACT
MTAKRFYITPEGKKMMEEKLENMAIRIKEIQEEKAVAYVISGDGWHDNPGFNQLEQMEHRAVEEMVKLKQHMNAAVVWEVTDERKQQVQIGSTVTYTQTPIHGGKAQKMIWTIVGHGESNVRQKKISYDSPLGKALMDKRIGEKAMLKIPMGEFELEVVSLS